MAGPPVEVQVRVNTGVAALLRWKLISSGIVTWPVGGKNSTITEVSKRCCSIFYKANL